MPHRSGTVDAGGEPKQLGPYMSVDVMAMHLKFNYPPLPYVLRDQRSIRMSHAVRAANRWPEWYISEPSEGSRDLQ
jgi:hypothetical protein